MNPLEDLFSAVGIRDVPPAQEQEIWKKILSDNLVMLRCHDLMVVQFAAKAIRQMQLIEREALIKRVMPAPQRGATKAQAAWTMHEALSNGHPYIQGWCHTCNQDLKFPGPPPRLHGNRVGISKLDVSNALDAVTFAHCGHNENLPADFRARAEQIFQRIVNVQE